MIYVYTLGEASIEIDPPAHAHKGIDATSEERRRARNRIVPSAPRRFAILLYLAMQRGRRVGREQLQSLVFPEQSPVRGRHSVREVLYKLRALGCEIVADNDDVMIPAETIWCDFADALAQEELSEATIRAMTGGFLARCVPTPSEAYGEWLEGLRGATVPPLSRRAVAVSASAARIARWELAELAGRACLALDPLNEEANCVLAEVLASGGAKEAAVKLLENYASEIGARASDLKLPVAKLRRRIGEGQLAGYAADGDARPGRARPVAFPPFIGRDAEMAALHDALARARGGEAQCVVVAGDPGIGKTRLVDEFSRAAALKGARVERVVIQPHDGERPMGAFVDAVPGLLRAPGALGCTPASMTALRNLTRQASDDATPAPVLDTEQHEQRWSAVSRAITDLCEAIATEAPLVLVVDDSQWLDALSANTIGRVVARRRTAAILVVLTSRDPRGVLRELRLTERCQTIGLGPLDAKSAEALLHALIPETASDLTGQRPSTNGGRKDRPTAIGLLKERIGSVSAGNPLFLVSLATTSRASNGSLNIPGTIIDSFTQRIDALSRRGQSVLATCVALGKHSSVSRLVAALELKSHELLESLLELTDAGLVLQNEQNAVPAHPLVSEALSVSLPASVRRAVAGSVASALERDAESGGSPALWWDVAESWRAADNPERAIQALRRCADHAIEIGRPGEAARILDHAIGLPQGQESTLLVATDMLRAARAAHEFLLMSRAATRLAAVQTTALHDDLEIATIAADLGNYEWVELHGDRLLRCARSMDASATHRVEAATILLKWAASSGMMHFVEPAIQSISAEDLAGVDKMRRLEFELLAQWGQGDTNAFVATARRMLRDAEDADARGETVLRYYVSAVTAINIAGCVDEAAEGYHRLFAMSERRGAYRCQLTAALHLGNLYWEFGSEDEGRTWLSRADATADEWPDLADNFDLAAARVEIALFDGRIADAEAVLAATMTRKCGSSEVVRRWLASVRLALRNAGRQVDKSDFNELLSMGENSTRTVAGVREFEVAVATEALAQIGALATARRILSGYLQTERNDRRPPDRLLRRAMRAVGVEEAANAHGQRSTVEGHAAADRPSGKRHRNHFGTAPAARKPDCTPSNA